MSEIVNEINRCIDKQSNYAYYKDLEYMLERNSNFRTLEQLEREFLIGRDIIRSDLYLAEIVAKFSFADIRMIYTELLRIKKEPAYSGVELPASTTEDNVRRAMKRLKANGIVRSFRFKSRNGENKELLIYCITETGLTLIKKQLYTSVRNADPMNSMERPEEAFRRLVGNFCGQLISKNYGAKNFIPGQMEYIRATGQRHFIYSKLFFEKDDKKTAILIEPIYFKADSRHVSEERMMEHNIERMEILNDRINLLKKKDPDITVKVIFIFEDRVGLTKAIRIIFKHFEYLAEGAAPYIQQLLQSDSDIKDVAMEDMPMLANLYFTSEPMLYGLKPGMEFLYVKGMKKGSPSVIVNAKLF